MLNNYVILLIEFVGKILLHCFIEHHITSTLVPLYMAVDAYWVFIFEQVIKEQTIIYIKKLHECFYLGSC